MIGRVLATVLALVFGAARIQAWHDRRGWRGRVGRYQLHGESGAAEIRAVGGPEEAAVWSELHHYPERFAEASIPPEMLRILDAADH